MVHSLVVPTYYDSGNVWILVAAIILVEVPQFLVLFRAVHVIEIIVVSQGLEVPADQERIDLDLKQLLVLLNLVIYLIKLPMAAPLNGNLSIHRSTFILV